jgi:hypothetical protein
MCSSKLVAQMGIQNLMVVTKTANGFWATISAMQSLGESKNLSNQNFSLPEDRCVDLLLKNLGKGMPEADVREELEALHIHVQTVMQLRSRRRVKYVEKDSPLTTNFTLPVAGGPNVAKVCSPTDCCCLRVKVEMYNAPKGLCNANSVSALGTLGVTVATHLGAWHVGTPTHQGNVSTQSSRLSAAAKVGNHTTNYRGCSKWKEDKAAATKRMQGDSCRKHEVSLSFDEPKAAPPGLYPEQESLGSG